MVDSTNLPAIDINAIATDLNNKADRDLVNSTVPYVVSRTSNEQGGVVEVWSDGYCVQNGIVTIASQQYGSTVVTLSQTMLNTNYTILLGGVNSINDGNYTFTVGNSITTNSFNIWNERTSGTNHANKCFWEVKGYIR